MRSSENRLVTIQIKMNENQLIKINVHQLSKKEKRFFFFIFNSNTLDLAFYGVLKSLFSF